MLERLGHHAYEIRKPEQLRDLDALIIPGGESTTIARLIEGNAFRGPIREFCASGRPVWGTCAGAILLAKHVDRLDRPGIEVMDISVARNAFGRQVDSFEADIDIKGLVGGPFRAVFIRAPIIESVSPPAGVVGKLADGTIVAARQGNLLATSFHPSSPGTRGCTSTSSGSGSASGAKRPGHCPRACPPRWRRSSTVPAASGRSPRRSRCSRQLW
jgi:5'-phosphate synthase pdxT subunit